MLRPDFVFCARSALALVAASLFAICAVDHAVLTAALLDGPLRVRPTAKR